MAHDLDMPDGIAVDDYMQWMIKYNGVLNMLTFGTGGAIWIFYSNDATQGIRQVMTHEFMIINFPSGEGACYFTNKQELSPLKITLHYRVENLKYAQQQCNTIIMKYLFGWYIFYFVSLQKYFLNNS